MIAIAYMLSVNQQAPGWNDVTFLSPVWAACQGSCGPGTVTFDAAILNAVTVDLDCDGSHDHPGG